MRISSILTAIFLLAAISASLLAFTYPLEIETRESSVWLNVLAMKSGINIYDHARVAFLNNTHGPFDPAFKFFVSSLLPFLDSWQVTRFAVLLLPYLFLAAAWGLLRKSIGNSFLNVIYLGSIGFIALTSLGDANMLLAGRSDATAILFFLPLVYLSVLFPPKTRPKTLFRGAACGILAACIVLTNLRFAPAIALLLIFLLWQYRYIRNLSVKPILIYLSGYLSGFLAICLCFLFFAFKSDINLYYLHFLSYAAHPDKWGDVYGTKINLITIMLCPALITLLFCSAAARKNKIENAGWIIFCLCVFGSCAAIYYLGHGGGDGRYFAPAVIAAWFFTAVNYPQISRRTANAVGIVILALYLSLSFGDSGGFPSRLALTMKEAKAFMQKVRIAEKNGSIVSEDSFFFRKTYHGELVDLGDYTWRLCKNGFFGKDFTITALKHFQKIKTNPPDFVITGLVASELLDYILVMDYDLIEIGPDNLIADRKIKEKFYSRLFVRKDFTFPARPYNNHASGER